MNVMERGCFERERYRIQKQPVTDRSQNETNGQRMDGTPLRVEVGLKPSGLGLVYMRRARTILRYHATEP
jgi:hypothetical protein